MLKLGLVNQLKFQPDLSTQPEISALADDFTKEELLRMQLIRSGFCPHLSKMAQFRPEQPTVDVDIVHDVM